VNAVLPLYVSVTDWLDDVTVVVFRDVAPVVSRLDSVTGFAYVPVIVFPLTSFSTTESVKVFGVPSVTAPYARLDGPVTVAVTTAPNWGSDAEKIAPD